MADALGLEHQICRAHVNRNVEATIGELGEQALEAPHPLPPELCGHGLTVEQVICGVTEKGQPQLEELLTRYQAASPPTQGQRASIWYRMR